MKKLVAALAIITVATISAASPPPPDTPEGILSFSDALLERGESYRAVTEYMRIIHHFAEDTPHAKKALLGLGNSYAEAKRWGDAAGAYSTYLRLEDDPAVRFKWGGSLYKAEINGPAITALSPLKETNENARRLATLAWLKDSEDGSPLGWMDEELIKQYRALPTKSRTVAGTLSVILPGAGHLYVDRPHDAILAFTVNAIFIWGTLNAIENDNDGAAVALGAMELIWYSGTIAGAVAGASKYNEREKERFFNRHEPRALPSWSLLPTNEGGLVAFTKRW